MLTIIRKFISLIPRTMHKVTSLDAPYYYIEELALDARGWLDPATGDWYRFADWKFRKGETTIATQAEIDAYRPFAEAYHRTRR